jgi:hypothetical protein
MVKDKLAQGSAPEEVKKHVAELNESYTEDLEAAHEVLELSRLMVTAARTQLSDGHVPVTLSGDAQSEAAALLETQATIHRYLAEVSMESENFDGALEYLETAETAEASLLRGKARHLADVQFRRGCALQLKGAPPADIIRHFRRAAGTLRAVTSLSPAESADEQAQLTDMIREVDAKIDECEDAISNPAASATTASTVRALGNRLSPVKAPAPAADRKVNVLGVKRKINLQQ